MGEFAVAREHAHLGKNAVVECAMALLTLSAAVKKSAHLGKNAAAQQNRVMCVMIPKIMHAKTCVKARDKDVRGSHPCTIKLYSPEIISQPVKSGEFSSGHEVEQAKDPSDHSSEEGRRILKRNSKGY
jgi:hypothetical protein